MARCYCRFRNILICVCTTCLALVLLFIYTSIMLSLHMSGGTVHRTVPILNNIHFVAPGASKNHGFAPVPHTFWENRVYRNAFWNQLQQAIDNRFNPILYPNKTKNGLARSSFGDSLLKRSFFKVVGSNNMWNNFEQLPKHLQEYITYMQRRDYPTLIMPDGLCGVKTENEKKPALILFAIKTTESNFKSRQAIRKTWGQVGWVAGHNSYSSSKEVVGGHVRRVFLLGKELTEEMSEDVSDLLKAESQHHGDILQWDFQDTFFNLTLKDVLFWRWFSDYCGQTHFVFKGDDDVFVNTPKLIGYLHDILKKPEAHNTMKDFMVGDLIGAAIPSRVKTSKYFIPENFYKGLYPTYAGGGGVVYSGLLAKRLHSISKTIHLFPIDDVYVGMCMIRLNALPVHHPAFLTFDFSDEDKGKPCSYHTILLVHKRSPKEVVDLWADLINTWTQCRGVPLKKEKKKVNF